VRRPGQTGGRDREGDHVLRRPGRAGQGVPGARRSDGRYQRGHAARLRTAGEPRLVAPAPEPARETPRAPEPAREMTYPRIGVLPLQGDVREHLAALASLGVPARTVRRPEELDAVEALVIPGGESTTMSRLAVEFGLLEPLRKRVAGGMPA